MGAFLPTPKYSHLIPDMHFCMFYEKERSTKTLMFTHTHSLIKKLKQMLMAPPVNTIEQHKNGKIHICMFRAGMMFNFRVPNY